MALIAQLGEHCTSIESRSEPEFFSGLCSSSVTAALALMTVITNPCFTNFDFQARLLIGKTSRQFLKLVKSVDMTMFTEARFSMRQNLCRQNIYFMKHKISF